jgi:hypothetical protein
MSTLQNGLSLRGEKETYQIINQNKTKVIFTNCLTPAPLVSCQLEGCPGP